MTKQSAELLITAKDDITATLLECKEIDAIAGKLELYAEKHDVTLHDILSHADQSLEYMGKPEGGIAYATLCHLLDQQVPLVRMTQQLAHLLKAAERFAEYEIVARITHEFMPRRQAQIARENLLQAAENVGVGHHQAVFLIGKCEQHIGDTIEHLYPGAKGRQS